MDDERVTSVTVPATFNSDTIVAGQALVPAEGDRYASHDAGLVR